MISNTVSGLELAWTILAVIGLLFVFGLFHRSMVDLVVSEQLNGGPLRQALRIKAARTGVLIFAGGLVTQLSYVIVGAVAMTQPQLHQHLTVASFVNAFTFMVASTTNTGLAVVIYVMRVQLTQQATDVLKETEER